MSNRVTPEVQEEVELMADPYVNQTNGPEPGEIIGGMYMLHLGNKPASILWFVLRYKL